MEKTCSRDGCARKMLAKGLCASHYYTERTARQREERRNDPTRPPCRHCGADLRGRDPRAVFCSVDCKEAAREDARRAQVDQKRVDRTCVHCGASIPWNRSTRAKTCSRECSVAWQNSVRQARKDEIKASRPPCQVCGLPMPEWRRRNAVYCSEGCKQNALSARWRAKAPWYMRKYLYGITQEQYEAMLEAQGNACAICGTTEWGGKTGVPHVDHDHDSKRVRGLLCDACNNGIGRMREDPERLRAAAAYIESHMT